MTKIAIPSRDGQVDEHFGHCGYFTVLTIGPDKSVIAEETFSPPAECGCKSNLVNDLLAMGVTALIAGNMGQGAVNKLRQSGMTVVRGASGPVGGVSVSRPCVAATSGSERSKASWPRPSITAARSALVTSSWARARSR